MEDKKLQSSIEEIKKIKMTSDEKVSMLSNILSSAVPSHTSVESPWMKYVSLSKVYKSKFLYYGAVICLIVFIGGREVVFASEVSLPGTVLYPIKVKIIEPISSAFQFSTEAKAKYESSLATKRLIEAETLASQNKLDEPKQKEITTLLNDHTKELHKNLEMLRTEKVSDDVVDDIAVNFEAGMNAHARILDVINEKDTVRVDSDMDNTIARNARENGTQIRTSFKGKESDTSEVYKKRKEIVKSLIDSTDKDLNEKARVTTSPLQQVIIDDTHKTLDKARQFLDQSATPNADSTHQEDAYSKLLDSESTVKEANIFLKASLNLKRGNGDSSPDKHRDDGEKELRRYNKTSD